MKLQMLTSAVALSFSLAVASDAFAQELPTAQPNPLPDSQPASPQRAATETHDTTQSRNPDEATGLGDIIVTATRREERLQDVPIAVTAITGESLNAQSVTGVTALQRITPNLRIIGVGGDPTNASISIRGQVNHLADVTIDPAVGLYINGIYLGRGTGGNLDMIDVQRVEALRGPQGTLFGRNTIGGAINVIPNTPSKNFEGAISGSYASYNAWNVLGIVNIPLAANLQVRAVASHSETDGFARSSLTGRRLGDDHKDFYRLSVNWDPTDTLNVLVAGDDWRYNSGGAWATFIGLTPNTAGLAALFGSAAAATAALTPYINPYTKRPASQTADDINAYSRGISGIVTLDLGGATIKSLTAYRKVNRLGVSDDSDSTPFIIVNEHGYLSKQHQFSQELQLFGKLFEDRLDYIFGLYYFDEHGVTATGTDVTNGIARTNTYGITQADAKSSSKAAFAQFTYSILDNLRLTGGIRYTEDVRKTTSTNRTVTPVNPAADFLKDPTVRCGTTGAAPQCALTPPTEKYHYFPFTVNLDWKPVPDILVYAKFSRGYRAGGFNTRPTVLGNVPAFDPERLDTYETGVKADLFDNHLRFNAAGFVGKYSKFVVIGSGSILNPATGILVPSAGAFNAGNATIKGLEFESTLVLGDLRLGGTLSLLDPKYDSVDPKVAASVLPTSTFRSAPKVQYSANGDYTVRASSGNVRLHADYSYIGKTFFAPVLPSSPLNMQKGYGIANASITFSLNALPIEVTVFGRNLANKKYLKFTIDTTTIGFIGGYPGDPRTYGVTGTYRF